ncbi:type II secretion system inner membrane protein GspF [Roseateles sp. SL47]|jgi:general secretion pathway protein F|uniref:type II secretion system inner membrane protein GspF n=1 Tax=Roseateles sp. SL47 TaxID=2995138 RepID=UPI00226ECE5E|nr:type II secretion system inner membrane protein GspF [Roseateles sp. SL47]WAC73290.1 type II secretion system inner membrane protein GspF [Roseateles sp. SL47]
MPAYKYEALDNAGKPRQGLLEADNPRAARAQLRGQGLVPMEVQAVAAPKASGRWSRRVFNGAGLSVWTRQLAGLVAAGLPLERSLAALADESEEARQRDLMSSLKAEVNAGSPFARALAIAPREFDDVYRAVVAAGEQSGALGPVLESLADDLEERQRLRSELFGALAYPIIVCFISLLAVGFLLTYVVPQVAAVFTQTRQTLPLLTRLMMGTSDLLRQWGLVLIVLVVGGVITARQILKKEGPRQRFDAAWLNMPIVGRISRGYNAARFSGTLAMLAGAGVPILKALQAAAETLSNHAMRADAMDALAQVREGAPLGAALAGKKRFPGLLSMFARLGEQTGQLPDMLQRAARQLGNEVKRRAMTLATLLEPLLIVAMGGVVMMIVLSVLLPIIDMNKLATQ